MRKQVAGALRRLADRLAPAPVPGIDIQVFREDGTWRKPPGATLFSTLAVGGEGGGPDGPGRDGLVVVASLLPDGSTEARLGPLPDEVPVAVGRGGGGGSGRFTPEEVRARQAQKFGRRAPVVHGGGGGGASTNGFDASRGVYLLLDGETGKATEIPVNAPTPFKPGDHVAFVGGGGAGGRGWRGAAVTSQGGKGGDGQPGETVTGQFS